jgi:hypothetical protein
VPSAGGIKRRIARPENEPFICTVRNVGYRFVLPDKETAGERDAVIGDRAAAGGVGELAREADQR